MMKTILMMGTALSILLLAACGAPATPPSIPTSPPSVPTSPPSVLPTMPTSPLNPPASPLNPGASPAPGKDAAVANSRNDLATRLNVDPGAITVVSVEQVDWPDGCLGVHAPGIMCTMVITPGYRVVLEANGKQYEYHTNKLGDVVRLATAVP